MYKLLKKQQGFTLIELIIVMVIIGILAVLLIPNLSAGPKRARDSRRKSDLATVQGALEQYFADKNSYPSGAYSGLNTFLQPDYIKNGMPADPLASQTYSYTPAGCVGTACTSYSLSGTLEYNKDASYPTYTLTNSQ